MPFDGRGTEHFTVQNGRVSWRLFPVDREDLAKALDRAADLVERGWRQGDLASNWFGFPCSPYSLFARRFCARGAIQRALWEMDLLDNLPQCELEIAREMLLAAPGTPLGARLLGSREWAAAMEDDKPRGVPLDLAAIERWNDNRGMTSTEVVQVLRFAAGELRRPP
jgi:hypothetical protein